jgi:hypothetical protein
MWFHCIVIFDPFWKIPFNHSPYSISLQRNLPWSFDDEWQQRCYFWKKRKKELLINLASFWLLSSFLNSTCWIQRAAFGVLNPRSWIQCAKSNVLHSESWIQRAEFNVLNSTCWIQGAESNDPMCWNQRTESNMLNSTCWIQHAVFNNQNWKKVNFALGNQTT